jgi:hypothetical protein
MLPAYAALHLIPMLVLRRKHVQRDPLGMLARAFKGTLRSSSFLGVFVVIFHSECIVALATARLSANHRDEFSYTMSEREPNHWADQIVQPSASALVHEVDQKERELLGYGLCNLSESVGRGEGMLVMPCERAKERADMISLANTETTC